MFFKICSFLIIYINIGIYDILIFMIFFLVFFNYEKNLGGNCSCVMEDMCIEGLLRNILFIMIFGDLLFVIVFFDIVMFICKSLD